MIMITLLLTGLEFFFFFSSPFFLYHNCWCWCWYWIQSDWMDVGSSSFFIYIYIEYDILPLYYYYYHIHKSSTYKCDTQKNKNSEREAMSTTDFLRCPKPYTPNARVRVGYVARDIRILALLFLFPSNLPSFLSTSPLLLSPRTVFCPPCIPPPGFQQFLPFPLLTENEPEAHP